MARESLAGHCKSAPLFPQSSQNKTGYTGEAPVSPVQRQNILAHTVHCSEHGYTLLDDARANLYPYRSERQSQICLKNQKPLKNYAENILLRD